MWGLAVVSVADPQSPKLLGTYTPPCLGTVCLEAVDVAAADGFTFVAGGYYGLLIINETDPTTPCLVSSFIEGYTYSVAASSASEVSYVGGVCLITAPSHRPSEVQDPPRDIIE
eukprot:TRINITY_DN1818_c0_g2_i1.p1 TRINITY_DN1818_c0_g2~~TRINITY_DN1818_c0_g2_i1.p1  ORF type:complete len:114 (+),score=20.60 TRINITY_DN1818_c0_g2_i1:58-399(+)